MPDPESMEADYAPAAESADTAVLAPPPEADPSSVVTTEDQFSTSTAPLTRDEMVRSYPDLTDQQADEEIDRLPYYNADQREVAKRRLDTYLEDQHHKLDSQRAEERERQLLDPDGTERAKFYNSPEVKQAVYLNQDPNKMWAKHVVRGVIEDFIKRPLLDSEYEAAKNKLIGGMAGVPKMGDSEALSYLSKRAEVGKETHESLQFVEGAVVKGMLEAVQTRKPYLPGDAWDAARKKYPNAAKDNEDDLYAYTMQAYENAKAMVGDNAPALLTGLTYIRKWQAGPTTPQDDQAFMDAMISIPPKDLQDAMATLTGMVKTEIADPNVVKNVINTLFTEASKGLGAKALVKGWLFSADFAQLQGMKNQILTDKARVDASGTIVFFPVEVPGGAEAHKPLSDEQKAAGLAQIERGFGALRVRSAMQFVTEPGLAPHITNYKKGTPALIERAIFGGAENLAPMLLAGAKKNLLGYGLYMATVSPSVFQRAMFENPEMDSRVATGMAFIEGNVNYIGDRLEFKAFGGAGAGMLKGLLGRAPLGKAVGRLAAAEISETAIESAQDYFSEIGKSTFQSILLKLHPDLNVGQIKSFDQAMKETWENLPEVAAQMFFLAGLGTGVLTYKDLTDPERTSYNREALRATGLNERTITSLLWETDFQKRDQDYRKAFAARTPEEINNGILYQQKQAQKIREQVTSPASEPAQPGEGETLGTERPRPTLEEVRQPDGTRLFNLLDENGTVVRENMTENVAASEYAAYDQLLAMEERQRRIDEQTSDEAIERTAKAEQTWELLSPRERTSTANVLEFRHNERPTPEQQRKLSAFQAALARDGYKDRVVLVNADVPTTRAGLGAARFISWFETTFGKSVQFVASETGQPLSFVGMVHAADPNTIFLDASGNRNVLAVLGHEWSHTLEKTNPVLWKDVMERMKPLVVDWAKALGTVDKDYKAEQATPEFVANVIGDAFADPEFWKVVKAQDQNLFQRMIAAIEEWFDTIMDHVTEWGTQAPDVIKDLQGMRKLIAEAVKTAQAGPEVEVTAEGKVSLATRRRDGQIEGMPEEERAAQEQGQSSPGGFTAKLEQALTYKHNLVVDQLASAGINIERKQIPDNWRDFHTLRKEEIERAQKRNDYRLASRLDQTYAYQNSEGKWAVHADYGLASGIKWDDSNRNPFFQGRMSDEQWGQIKSDHNDISEKIRLPQNDSSFDHVVEEQTYAGAVNKWWNGILAASKAIEQETPIIDQTIKTLRKLSQEETDIQAGQLPLKPGYTIAKEGDEWVLRNPKRGVMDTVPGTRTEQQARVQFVLRWRKFAFESSTPSSGVPGTQAAAPRGGHGFEERGAREKGEGYITPDEVKLMDQDIAKILDKRGLKKGAARNKLAKQIRDDVHADVLSRRKANPDAPTEHVKDPWSPLVFTGVDAEFRDAKEGEKTTVKSVAKWQKQNYRFDQIPEGMTREAWAKELGGRIMQQWLDRMRRGFAPGATAEDRAGAQTILDEIEWYRDFTGRLRGEFGGFADLMADFLGAFSPRQNVRQNWRNAIDAIWAISNGKYDVLLAELDAYLKEDPARTIKTWRDQGGAVMTSRNGALFGTNTERGMIAALGLWREIKYGDKPKAKNFTRNLIALSIRATIDVWAARLLDRVAGKPRIPVDAEGAVTGEHISEKELWKKFGAESLSASADLGNLPIKGQFAFGQEVFEDVAARMRDPKNWEGSGLSAETIAKFANVTASDVQATNWFVEKEIWTANNWTNDEGSGGSFMFEISQMLGTRFQAGISQQISGVPGVEDFLPQDPDQARFATELRDDLSRMMPDAIALRVMDSLGMFMGSGERSTDTEWVHGPGMEPNDVIRQVLYHAWSKDQAATHLSRIITDPEEDVSENARPGIEVMFKADVDLRTINAAIAILEKNGINGFTMVVDPRAGVGAQRFLGVRFQYIPEYSGDGGKRWVRKARVIRSILLKAGEQLAQMPGVADARTMLYDTLVFEKGRHYDDAGIHPGGVGTVEARAWRRRYYDAVAKEAVRRDGAASEEGREGGQVGAGEQVPSGERVQEGGPAEAGGLAPEGPTLPVTVFDSDLMEFAPREMVATPELLRKLKADARLYDQILSCLSS